jgi:hypothetical protein
MSHTNGSFAVNGNGHGSNGHSLNGHPGYIYKATWRDKLEDWWMEIGDFKYTAIGILFWVGFFACVVLFNPHTDSTPTPDSIDLIQSHIDGIDLNKPKAEVQKYLDTIKGELDQLRPEELPDETDQYGGA